MLEENVLPDDDDTELPSAAEVFEEARLGWVDSPFMAGFEREVQSRQADIAGYWQKRTKRRGAVTGGRGLATRLTPWAQQRYQAWLYLEKAHMDAGEQADLVAPMLGIAGCTLVEHQLRAMLLPPILHNANECVAALRQHPEAAELVARIIDSEFQPTMAALEWVLKAMALVHADDADRAQTLFGAWWSRGFFEEVAAGGPGKSLAELRRRYRNPLMHATRDFVSADYGKFVRIAVGTDLLHTWDTGGAAPANPDWKWKRGTLDMHLAGWVPSDPPPGVAPSRVGVAVPAPGRTEVGLAALDDVLAKWSVLEVVTRFDLDFDVPYRHTSALGLLEMHGAFEPAPHDAPTAELAAHVGAAWCRTVAYDMRYDLLEGARWVKATRASATELSERLSADPANADLNAAYAAARWFDGAGKMHYRVADGAQARLDFRQAIEIATTHDLWWLLPDLWSNATRTGAELDRMVGKNLSRQDVYESLLGRVQALAERQGLALTKGAPPGLAQQSPRIREFYRGVCSVYHNAADETQRIAEDEASVSYRWSTYAADIAAALSDEYRRSQATGHQGRLHLEWGRQARNSGRLEDAERHLTTAESLIREGLAFPWIRGRRIARQNLAKVQKARGDLETAHATLRDLVAELREDLGRPGGDAGLDLGVYRHTVDVLAEVALATRARDGDTDETARMTAAVLNERLLMVRAVRRVVTLSLYKRDYAKHVEPVYRAAIERDVASDVADARTVTERQEDAFALVEESTGRELLDILQQQEATDGDATGTAATPEILGRERIVLPEESSVVGGEARRRRRRAVTRLRDKLEPELLAAIQARRKRYDDAAMDCPIPTASHDSEIARRVRMFTTNHPDVAIVRFFQTGEGDAGLGAYVFRADRMAVHQGGALALEPVMAAWREHLDAVEKGFEPAPPVAVAKAMSQHLIEPLWDDIRSVSRRLVMPEQLVIVPTGSMFALPLHVAFEPGTQWPLAATMPLALSVSATAFAARGRHLLRRQTIEEDDDLCVLAKLDEDSTGGELRDLDWPADHFHWAGEVPSWLDPAEVEHIGPATREALGPLMAPRPEVFVYTGHGVYNEGFADLGPALKLDGDLLTQHDIAMTLRMPRNKLTLLGACVTGQGVSIGGGEVAGFVRAFMAAGCGALGVTLWPVADDEMVRVAGRLLRAVRRSHGAPVDLLAEVHQASVDGCKQAGSAEDRIEACPLVMYL